MRSGGEVTLSRTVPIAVAWYSLEGVVKKRVGGKFSAWVESVSRRQRSCDDCSSHSSVLA
jgi:hypothetical protein